MFWHGYDSYGNYAGWGRDELKPLSCSGHNKLGGLSVTLIDSLDMLAVLGAKEEFTKAVNWVIKYVSFEKDVNVSVFETNIRVLGGLLSAHVIASNQTLGMYVGEYDASLLNLAVDLGNRLLRAFNTPTGLPIGTVNLKYGIPRGETRVVCSACVATYSLEFGLLSSLTGNPIYEMTAKQSAEKLFSVRSAKGLLSTHLEVDHGRWVHYTTAGLGGDTDSVYEYFYKAGIAFNDSRYMEMFEASYAAIDQSLAVSGDGFMHYVDNDFQTGVKILNVRSLSAFWPGIQAALGEVEKANKTIHSFAEVLLMFGFLPESICATTLPHGPRIVTTLGMEKFQKGLLLDGYPLRPELVESVYHLYKKTKDKSLLKVGLLAMQGLRMTKVTCGFCSVHGVISLRHFLVDQMDSFFLSETLKYLYLLWDLASQNEEKNWVNRGNYIFTTEAHLVPITRSTSAIVKNIIADEL